jgi:transketolase
MTAEIRKRETRDGYGEALVRLAHAHRDVVALDCDLGRSTRAHRITEVDTARFFDMGIAEQDMLSTAAGMARMGKTVFVNSFAVFVTGRAFDQIRQQVALPRANVKVCGSSAGITQGADGATHQSVLDLALMRCLPHMTVVVPADARQAELAVAGVYDIKGPAYLRLSRYPTPDYAPAEGFRVGKAQILREGQELCFCGCGPILYNVLAAADQMKNDGLNPGVVNFHTLKPLDVETLQALAKRCRVLVSVEEHSIYGGLGSALAEALADHSLSTRLVRLGVNDTFGESGSADELLAKHGLDAAGIAAAVRRAKRNDRT